MKIEKHGAFFKVDETAQIAYGWAIVCTENGEDYVDLQGDHIPEDVMVKAAIDFAANSRVGKDMHAGDRIGDCLFTYPVTKQSAELGVPTAKTGLLIGFKPDDPAMLDLIKQGKRTGFSIGGFITDSVEETTSKTIAKSADGTKTRRVFRSFKINEISLVDVPAMEGATVGYVKRAIALRTDRVAKSSLYTDLVDGHQHRICVYDDGSMYVEHATMSGAEYSHSHGIVFEGGVLTILADSGHSHELAEGLAGVVAVPADAIVVVQARKGESADRFHLPGIAAPALDAGASPTTNRNSGNSATEKSTRPAQTNQSRKMETKIVVLTDAQHAHYAKLASAEADAFLLKSSAERDGVLAEIAKADAVIWKGEITGLEVRKSHGDFALKLAQGTEAAEKRARDATATAEVEKAAREATELKKRAAETMPNLAGSDDVHCAILKAVESIADAKIRDEAVTALKAANAAAKSLEVAKGFNPGSDPQTGDGLAKFNTGLEAFAKSKGKSPAAATAEFLATPEGDALYIAATTQN